MGLPGISVWGSSSRVKEESTHFPYRNWIFLTSESFFYFGISRSLIKQTKQLPFSKGAQTEFRKATGSLDYLWNKLWKSIRTSFFSFLLINLEIHIHIVEKSFCLKSFFLWYWKYCPSHQSCWADNLSYHWVQLRSFPAQESVTTFSAICWDKLQVIQNIWCY